MKRTTTEVLRRGFDVTVANWPLIALRIVESLILGGITVAAILAAIIPIAISAGLGNFQIEDVSSASNAVAELLIKHWVLVIYALLVITLLLIILVAVHAFFDGGTARVLVDSERAGAQPAFNMSRWLDGGRTAWWRIFWMYNIVWSVAGVVLLLPLVPTLVGVVAVSEATGRVVIACAGLLLTVLILIPTAVVAGVWTQKAIALCVGRDLTATESIRVARQEMSRDFGRHLAVACIVFAVSIGGAMVIAGVSAPMSLLRNQQPMMLAFTAPVQIVVSFLQSIFSAATGAWFLASFITMTEER